MFREIYQSVNAHRDKLVLTGISVTWGVLILVMLIGCGEGLKKGIMKVFDGFNKKTVWAYMGQTSETFQGFQAGRRIVLKYEDINLLKNNIEEIEYISPECTNWSGSLVSYKEDFTRVNIKGVDPDYFKIKILNTSTGRLINDLDNQLKRRVVLLGEEIKDLFFGDDDPVGKYINIDNNYFLVIGVIQNTMLNSFESREMYIPYNAYYDIYTYHRAINVFLYSVNESNSAKNIESYISQILAKKYVFDAKDEKTIFFNHLEEQEQSYNSLFSGVNYFLLFVGLSSLLSGIFGVSNIMFITVRERTKEIGIRKALGAKPFSIKIMITIEAVLLTLTFGLIGLGLGLVLLELVSTFLNSLENVLIEDVTVNYFSILISFILLTIAGVFAGLMPADKASRIFPVIALKDE